MKDHDHTDGGVNNDTSDPDDSSARNPLEQPDAPARDTVSFSDRADMITDTDDRSPEKASGPSDRPERNSFEESVDSARDTVSFSDRADIIHDADATTPTTKAERTFSETGGHHGGDETELPLGDGNVRHADQKRSPSKSVGTEKHGKGWLQKRGSDAEAELDESLIDRMAPIDDEAMASREFGLSLESEGEETFKPVAQGTVTTSGDSEARQWDAKPVGIAVPDSVELDANLNFPEVLIALSHESRIKAVKDATADDRERKAADSDPGENIPRRTHHGSTMIPPVIQMTSIPPSRRRAKHRIPPKTLLP